MSAKETWSTVTLMPLLSPHFTAMGSNQASYAGTKWLHVMIRSSRWWAWPLLPSAGDDRTQREATGTFVPGAGRGDDQKAKNDAAQQRQPLLRRRPQGPWRDCQSDDRD